MGAAERSGAEIGSQTAQTVAVESGETARVGAGADGQAAEAATQKTGVLNHAFSTAAAVYDDVAQIPYVGWLLAPAAAAASFAAVAAFGGSISSAEGGHESVARDGQMFRLHYEESVLPRQIAKPLMGLARSGGLEPAALAAPAMAAMTKAAPSMLAGIGSIGASAAPMSFAMPPGFGRIATPSLPASANDGGSTTGSGGDTYHVTISAADTAGMANMLQRQPMSNALVRTVQRAVANGATLGPRR